MSSPNKKGSAHKAESRVTLKTVAEHLGLTPGTISAALNNSAAARSIPERTKKRIFAAAKDLNYPKLFCALVAFAAHLHNRRDRRRNRRRLRLARHQRY